MQPKNETQPRRFHGRPIDRSLQAYKDFIRGMTLALNPDAKDDITEEQWRQSWQQFWVAASEEPRSNQE